MPNPTYTGYTRKHYRNPDVRSPLDKGSTLPNTPTRITIPASSVFDQAAEIERLPTTNYSSSSNSQEVDEASVEESYIPPVDDGLDDLWEALRQKKELKMAKETPKVQSLQDQPVEEEFSPIEAPDVDVPVGTPRPETLRRQKSITSFRESPDGRIIAAFIEMRGVQKQDVHVSYSRNRLVISWKIVEISEYEENGRVIRERLERDFQRVHPLPEGTRFEEISGVMNGRFLVLRYPNSRSFRVENRPSSVVS
ncbi:hypothetical protein GGU11DRAFT_726127 [Lentinula aff. detonsa]|uniref:SHSP domain-containing protein n=1 Tax=Lentinula aff. detonsa TaxID=2804958 RepID=A0AA38NL74_9AGAR|nr:hypothetical protein GGU10DRAFT_359944 [Lentinula aff. detonsa]KAJ3796875.1 hypothetical protein GGU11DRAFT_726127 [Lentinula aff. detonsa]